MEVMHTASKTPTHVATGGAALKPYANSTVARQPSSGASASEVQPVQLIYAPEDGCLATVEFTYGHRAAPPVAT